VQLADITAEYNLVAEFSLCYSAVYHDKLPFISKKKYECKACHLDLIKDYLPDDRDTDDLLDDDNSLSILTINDPDARILKDLLNILPAEYYTDYVKWRNVIFALANSSPNYYAIAKWFSQKSAEKYREESFNSLWDSTIISINNDYGVSKLTKRSIYYWANQENPEKCQELRSRNYYEILANYIYTFIDEIEHYTIAKMLKYMIGNKFCSDRNSQGQVIWYEFIQPGQAMQKGEVYKWRQIKTPTNARIYISEKLPIILRQLKENTQLKLDNSANAMEIGYLKKVLMAIKKSNKKLYNHAFKNGVIGEAVELFELPGFIQSLNKDPHVLGVGNGILVLSHKNKDKKQDKKGKSSVDDKETISKDLQDDEIKDNNASKSGNFTSSYLVKDFHEFSVSSYTPVDYIPYDPENPNEYQAELLQIINDSIPEKDAFEKIMFYCSQGVYRGKKRPVIMFFPGGGSNGKSLLLDLMRNTLGKNYAGQAPFSLLTTTREKPNEPNSAIMQYDGKGWMSMDESEPNEKLKSDRLKLLAGGTITASDKNEKQKTFDNNATTACATNYPPDVEFTDHGTWRRFLLYWFKVKYCSNPDPANPLEKKDNPAIVEEYIYDRKYQEAFLGILVHYWDRLQSEYNGDIKAVPSPTIDRETEQFRRTQDTIHRFIMECIVVSTEELTHDYNIATLANEYINWYRKNINLKATPSVKDIISKIEDSRIKAYLHPIHNTKVLKGCRLLQDGAGELFPGETYL
jgi:phage/plasmid-associated DNA primase